MTRPLDETHDPTLRSWVASADGHPDFPIQNLPLGVFRRRSTNERRRVGVAIGDGILDLAACVEGGLLPGIPQATAAACAEPVLNRLMELGPDAGSALRRALSRLLAASDAGPATATRAAERLLVPMQEAELSVPASIGDYTDFYASVHHAANVGALFRPDHPLLPNYKWVPIGYHGRASSIVPSGAPVRRPEGQVREDPNAPPRLAPTRRLDYELEVGLFVGPGNALGQPIPIAEAERHLFGICLVNDWSARDVQAWEYQPLGPFLSKNFATTVSPWVVTVDALAPFRAPALSRPPGDPAPLPYLLDERDQREGAIDVTLEVWLSSAAMRHQGVPPVRVSRGRLADLYWTPAQLVTHHASGGCNLRPGDLLASGTVSGPERDSLGCLLELTRRGADPIRLPTGEQRAFLEDGDEVVMRGWCEREGAVRIGLGECRGRIVSSEQ